ncbi:AraC family transcriptional regulator [Nitrospirillum amazonense]|uniref:AraC family transcriptional regulator n=1 Tax=Nitrospirillum amazonense TaxID=28077 RepID=A0A560K9M1_9PROT|nr:helix-turn-helix transcriptional regulator [Nitrospirillum amazonense]MDG3441491.1 helix-turn-helix transcriptional regulator [Nitrospirillum amazonense]TWB80015.1 AraC family transcriptional regulator [Nitrospirillum amazonense]
MPILRELPSNDQDWPGDLMDPDDVPRPIAAFGIIGFTNGIELAPHRHRKAQLLLAPRGVLTCEAESGLWLVPPNCALWIPAETLHSLKVSGTVDGYNAFIDPAVAAILPAHCCTVSATPLLTALLMRAASLPQLYPEDGPDARLVTVLLDEIAAAPEERLHLPMPTDARLRRLVALMMADPGQRGTMEQWAKRVGMSERTLARLLTRETGMSFGQWRQQLILMLALQRMAEGAPVQQVALDLGYESASSFVTMFRKALGSPPAQYMARQRGAEPLRNP